MIRFQEKHSLFDTTLVNINEFYIIILIIVKNNRKHRIVPKHTQALLSVAVYNIYIKRKTRTFILLQVMVDLERKGRK